MGGIAWHNLQYVLRLMKMGHSVVFIEDSEKYPPCYNPITFEWSAEPTY
jgi:hypothetical protein